MRLLPHNELVEKIGNHYDRLSFFYNLFWGPHIHHGFWEGNETPLQAQENLIRKCVEGIGLRGQEKILDAGCGLGGSSRWLAQHFGWSVEGITISPKQVKMAIAQTKKDGLEDRVRFHLMDVEAMSFPPESFDVVWSLESAEHFSDKRRFIHDATALLKPGGVLMVCTWLEGINASHHQKLLEEICDRVILPPFARKNDYLQWITEANLTFVKEEDLTSRVTRTWDLATAIVESWKVKFLLNFLGTKTREYVRSIPMMKEAYSSGAMSYGYFVAKK
jgi:tocopherol O-methyltransferase